MVGVCCVPMCRNNAFSPGISLHVLPHKETLRKAWILRIRRTKKISNSMRVCSAHFVESDFIIGPNGRRALKKDAEPSIFSLPTTRKQLLAELVPDKKKTLAARLKNIPIFEKYLERKRQASNKRPDLTNNNVIMNSASNILINLVPMEMNSSVWNIPQNPVYTENMVQRFLPIKAKTSDHISENSNSSKSSASSCTENKMEVEVTTKDDISTSLVRNTFENTTWLEKKIKSEQPTEIPEVREDKTILKDLHTSEVKVEPLLPIEYCIATLDEDDSCDDPSVNHQSPTEYCNSALNEGSSCDNETSDVQQLPMEHCITTLDEGDSCDNTAVDVQEHPTENCTAPSDKDASCDNSVVDIQQISAQFSLSKNQSSKPRVLLPKPSQGPNQNQASIENPYVTLSWKVPDKEKKSIQPTTVNIIHRCCVPDCESNFKPKSLTEFFSFPTDPEIREKWVRCLNAVAPYVQDDEPGHETLICIKHFERRFLISTFDQDGNDNSSSSVPWTTLTHDALPTVFNFAPSIFEKPFVTQQTPEVVNGMPLNHTQPTVPQMVLGYTIENGEVKPYLINSDSINFPNSVPFTIPVPSPDSQNQNANIIINQQANYPVNTIINSNAVTYSTITTNFIDSNLNTSPSTSVTHTPTLVKLPSADLHSQHLTLEPQNFNLQPMLTFL